MGKYISLGEYNKNYKYIFLYLFFRALNDCIDGLEYNKNNILYEDIYFFGDKAKAFFNEHVMINTIFSYFAMIILSLILIKYVSYIKNNKSINKNIDNSESSINLIYNKPEISLNYNMIKILLYIFLIIFIWVFIDLLEGQMSFDLNDFWSFKMVFAYFVGKKMFNIQIYKHQIFAISFILIFGTILLVISTILKIIKISDLGIIYYILYIICFINIILFFHFIN